MSLSYIKNSYGKKKPKRERERKDGQYWAIIGLASFSA
jgi:hypothetical protein